MKKIKILFLFFICYGAVAAQNKNEELQFLLNYVSIPNDANYKEHIEKNLDWLDEQFAKRNFKIERIPTPEHDLFFAERIISTKLPTVLFYMHFDGQPVDSSKWDQQSPYIPVIKESVHNEWQEVKEYHTQTLDPDWRVFARSSSDDKGPIAMFLMALDRLQSENKKPVYNIKIILDSQEEQGSPHVAYAVENNREKLSADYFVVFDGPMHDSGKPTLTYGVRGIISITMEIFTLRKPQHSGHFGNYAPNPVFSTSHLLASMKDQEGRVTIPGFYDHISIDEKTSELLAKVPDDPSQFQQRVGFSTPEKVGRNYQESIQYPSLNVSGISAGWVREQRRTIVPASCIVEMDIRTVPESDSERLISLLQNHITAQGYTILDHEPSDQELMSIEKPIFMKTKASMFPFRTKMDSPIGQWLRTSIKKAHNEDPVEIRIGGGSVPLSFFINELDVPTVLVPVVNADNNQHSPNENLRLGNYFDGIETIKAVLTTSPK